MSGAFKDISDYLSHRHLVSTEQVYYRLMELWKQKGSMHEHLFDDLLTDLGLMEDIGPLVHIFNSHKPIIEPYIETVQVLQELKAKGIILGVITDGNVERQKRKIESLGISKFFKARIYTMEIGKSKASVRPFLEIAGELKVDAKYCAYVGDNPILDFKGAKKAGMRTVRLLRGEFRNLIGNKDIDYEISDLRDILTMI